MASFFIGIYPLIESTFDQATTDVVLNRFFSPLNEADECILGISSDCTRIITELEVWEFILKHLIDLNDSPLKAFLYERIDRAKSQRDPHSVDSLIQEIARLISLSRLP